MPIPIETTIEDYHAMPFHEPNHLYFCVKVVDGKKKIVEAWRGDFRISAPYEFYIEMNEAGEWMMNNSELATDCTYLFFFKKVSSGRIVCPRLIVAKAMFNTANSQDGSLDVEFPVCTNAMYLCIYSLFNQIKVSAPLAIQTDAFASNCPNLHTLIVDLPRLKLADGFAQNSPRLETVSTNFQMLSTGKNMFSNCKLSATTINAILESLPTWADGKAHVITFTGCPGAVSCSPEIATTKGWTVEL